jgi:RimJ/RimL family protein N-acetyltransferase
VSPTLPSPRLILRELVVEDWPAVHDYARRAEACRYQPWGPNTPDESRAFVEAAVASSASPARARYALALTLASPGRLIGVGELNVRSVPFRTGEISYIVHPDLWGQGFATEAAAALLRFGFDDLGLHRIYATCDPRNVASGRVLQKCGLAHEGRRRHDMLLRDGWRDSDLYAILEDEWRALP